MTGSGPSSGVRSANDAVAGQFGSFDREGVGDSRLVCEVADEFEIDMEEHFAIDEAFLATCTKPGLVEIVRANPDSFDVGLKPAGKTMKVLREWILAAANSGSLDGFVPREGRFGSAVQLDRLAG